MTRHPSQDRPGQAASSGGETLAVQRFEAALAAAPIIVAEVDSELRYTWVHNPHPEFTVDEVLGKRDDEIGSGPGIEELVELKGRVLATGEGTRAEIGFDLPGGRTWYDISIEPRRSEDGRLLGLTTAALDITERIRYQAELTATHRIVNASPVMAIVWRNETGWPVEHVSHNVEAILGYDAAEFTGDRISYLELVHPDDTHRVTAEVRTATQDGALQFRHEPYRLRTASGGYRWVDDRTTIHRDGRDRVERYEGTVIDITERKETEDALRRSQELLVETGRMARVGGWEIDLETDQVHWTVTTREIHEVDSEYEPVLDDALSFFPGDAGDRLARAVRAARKEGRSYDLELPFVTARGRQLWVRTMGHPEMEDGVCVRLTGTFHDITAQKEHETALRQQKEMLARTEEIAGIGSWDWDLDTDRITWSDGVFRIFGLDPAGAAPDWAGHRDLMDDGSMARLDAAVRECRTDGTPFAVEVSVVRADGTAGIFVTRGRREHREDGVHLAGFVEDVTEEKQLEEERHRLQEQIEQSQRLETVGRLAGGIAHDFNNILTAITGHAAAIEEADGIPKGLEDEAGLIVEAAERAAGLTRQLLAFGRRQFVQKRHVSLGETVRGMGQMLQRIVPETIRLEVVAPVEGTTVYADPGQLEQIVLNLVVNAADAIDGHGTIRMHVDPDPADPAADDIETARSCVCLTVRDDGEGIPPEIQARIFEPFFTTKSDGSGTGLGLATVYGIVQQADGRIEVDSEPGVGTSFRVFLPAASARPVTPEPVTPRESRDASTRDGRVVLIVEDDSAVRRVVQRTLARAGLQTLQAEDGLAALELIQRSNDRIDLVISDVVMPKMSGVELRQRLHEDHPDLPVILTSGYSEEELPSTTDTRTLILHKPFTPAELRERVDQALGL